MSDQDPHGDPTRVDTPVGRPARWRCRPPPAATTDPPSRRRPTSRRRNRPTDGRWILIALVVADPRSLGSRGSSCDDDDSDDTDTGDDHHDDDRRSTTTTSVDHDHRADHHDRRPPPRPPRRRPPSTRPDACRPAPDDPDTDGGGRVRRLHRSDDRACASNLMTAAALDQLFAHPRRRRRVDVQGLPGRSTTPTRRRCAATRFEGGSTTFRMNYSDTDGWTVYEVFQTAD